MILKKYSITLSILRTGVFGLALIASAGAHAQVLVTAAPDHAKLLASQNPTAAANKRLVYDFWREVREGGHLELTEKYLAESYVQHNPNVPTGRAGFVEWFSRLSKPKPIDTKVKAPLVDIVAEGDQVVLSFVAVRPDPADKSKTYTTTWFDMFRVENGKIAEHWDSSLKK